MKTLRRSALRQPKRLPYHPIPPGSTRFRWHWRAISASIDQSCGRFSFRHRFVPPAVRPGTSPKWKLHPSSKFRRSRTASAPARQRGGHAAIVSRVLLVTNVLSATVARDLVAVGWPERRNTATRSPALPEPDMIYPERKLDSPRSSHAADVSFTLNGKPERNHDDERMLLWCCAPIRLTGTKFGCGEGCARVHRRRSTSRLSVCSVPLKTSPQARRHHRGPGHGDKLHPVQEASSSITRFSAATARRHASQRLCAAVKTPKPRTPRSSRRWRITCAAAARTFASSRPSRKPRVRERRPCETPRFFAVAGSGLFVFFKADWRPSRNCPSPRRQAAHDFTPTCASRRWPVTVRRQVELARVHDPWATSRENSRSLRLRGYDHGDTDSPLRHGTFAPCVSAC